MEAISVSVYLWILFALFVLIIADQYLLNPLFLSPLRHIPTAHSTCAVSSAWITWTRFRRHENRSVFAAHRKHGPVLRLGPQELSINCVDDGIRTVYGGGFEKSDWYNTFRNFGHSNMFSSLDSKSHAARKRMLASVYSKSFLHSSSGLEGQSVEILYGRLLPLLDRHAASLQPLDMYEIFLATSMDFITAYLFGLSGFANFIQDKAKRKRWLSAYQSRYPFSFYTQDARWLVALGQKFGVQLLPKHIQEHTEQVEALVSEMCDAAGTKLDAMGSGDDLPNRPADYPLVYSQLHHNLRKGSTTDNDDNRVEVYSELCDHIIAGHETSGITLTYLAYELSRNPSIQTSLRTELSTLSPPFCTVPSADPGSADPGSAFPPAKALDALPLLNAVILETFRLYPAVAGGQPRITPYGKKTKLGIYPAIPGGVRVGARASTLHMNPKAFPSPESWRPQRWLETKGPELAEMHRWMWVFGSGGRMCIGSNFALHEIKLVTTFVYSKYETEVVGDPDMRPSDEFAANPVGGALMLRLKHVAPGDSAATEPAKS